LGFQRALSIDPAGRPLPRAVKRASVESVPALDLVPSVVSHHFDGFLRPEDAGLLHPAADPEVRRVSCVRGSRDGLCETSGSGKRRSIPHDAIHTLRSIPPDCSRTPSLGPLPPCRSILPSRLLIPVPFPVPGFGAPSARPSTSRPSSAVGSVAPTRPFPVGRCPILPWALFLSEGLLRAPLRHPQPLARPDARIRSLRRFEPAKSVRSRSRETRGLHPELHRPP